MASPTTSYAQNARAQLRAGGRDVTLYRLDSVSDELERLPFTVKVLLEIE